MAATVSVWNGWDFENVAKGPRGERGQEGDIGPRGTTGSTGPTGEIGLAGPAGRSGEAGPLSKGPVAPFSRFVQDGADGTTKYLYAMSNFRRYERSGLPYKQRIEGENNDAYGLGLVAVEVSGSEGAWNVKGSFVRSEYYNYDSSGNVARRIVESFSKQVSTLYNTDLWTGYLRLEKDVYVRLRMQERKLEFYSATLGYSVFDCNIITTSSPSGNYVYRQADNAPTKDDTLSLVSSGGIAAAYCSLIDKIAQYKGLTAAQVAQMKALYGA